MRPHRTEKQLLKGLGFGIRAFGTRGAPLASFLGAMGHEKWQETLFLPLLLDAGTSSWELVHLPTVTDAQMLSKNSLSSPAE